MSDIREDEDLLPPNPVVEAEAEARPNIPPPANFFEFRDVNKAFDDRVILNDVSFTVKRAETARSRSSRAVRSSSACPCSEGACVRPISMRSIGFQSETLPMPIAATVATRPAMPSPHSRKSASTAAQPPPKLRAWPRPSGATTLVTASAKRPRHPRKPARTRKQERANTDEE